VRKSFNLLFASLFALTSLAVAGAAQQHPQKPGKWQVKVEMEIPGMPQKPPAQTMEVCVTEADLKDPEKLLSSMPNSDCKISDYKVKDQTVSYNLSCPSQQLTASGEMKYTGDVFEGTMKTKMGAQEMTAKYTGKWLSTCTK
jgi:hypothetical protein